MGRPRRTGQVGGGHSERHVDINDVEAGPGQLANRLDAIGADLRVVHGVGMTALVIPDQIAEGAGCLPRVRPPIVSPAPEDRIAEYLGEPTVLACLHGSDSATAHQPKTPR